MQSMANTYHELRRHTSEPWTAGRKNYKAWSADNFLREFYPQVAMKQIFFDVFHRAHWFRMEMSTPRGIASIKGNQAIFTPHPSALTAAVP